MEHKGVQSKKAGLDPHGLKNLKTVHWNYTAPALYEAAISAGEASIATEGPLLATTGSHTGRAPKDKFIVREPGSEAHVWWGEVNRPFEPAAFDALHNRVAEYLEGREVFVQDCFVGADATYRLPIRVITERAWHNLFAQNMFIPAKDLENHAPEFTVIQAPGFKADPARDGTNSEVFIILNFAKKLILIGGTEYAGEIKKSIFSVMTYILPLQKIMAMHCSANEGPAGDVALFFGLSGTGKTTLSADPDRTLIGDDEHGWSDNGVFNFEGGCYAKVIRLNPEAEPEIYATTRRFGTVLENVVMDPVTRELDLDDDSLTENTRASYPISHIPNATTVGLGGSPNNVVMLTCDAFGVLPPISRMTPDQAMYHFISGYTAKVAGTEQGVTEPTATFSTCFGAPFMTLHPSVYADLLRAKIDKQHSSCWLVNTGWSGGGYGEGERMKIKYTRAMVNAALSGELDSGEFTSDPIFGLGIPNSVSGVPDEVLNPRNTWKDKAAFDKQAAFLAGLFVENFKKYSDGLDDAIKNAGPKAR